MLDYHHQPRFSEPLQTRLDDALDTFWQALTRRHLATPAPQFTRRTLHA
ncbi:FMN reductase [Cronobacter sakazakii 696]|nr:FMN reductase [Cronobacter sakazakii 696]